MVSRFSGYIVLGLGIVGVEHKLDLRLRNVLIAGSFG